MPLEIPPVPGRAVSIRRSDDAVICVQWAVDAMVAGADSPSLRILAGLTPPLDSGEVADYARKAWRELNITVPTGDAVRTAYVRDILGEILANPDTMAVHLRRLSNLFNEDGGPSDLQPFYLLRLAYEDLQAGTEQYYWDGAHRSNIRHVVQEQCREWLASHP